MPLAIGTRLGAFEIVGTLGAARADRKPRHDRRRALLARWQVDRVPDSRKRHVSGVVAAFPAFDQRRRVSSQGGGQQFWRGDGRELFYLTPTGELMSVRVQPDTKGSLDFAAPAELFQSPLPNPNLVIDPYSVTTDGQRFLFIRPTGAGDASRPVTVVVNWAADLVEAAACR